jgi:hypothetical protein
MTTLCLFHSFLAHIATLLTFALQVCRNHAPHLRGNVYIHYDKVDDAVAAHTAFNGRFYAGKQLICEFAPLNR